MPSRYINIDKECSYVRKRLTRKVNEKKIAGVCAGVADYLDRRSNGSSWMGSFILISWCWWFLLYALLWFLLPEAE